MTTKRDLILELENLIKPMDIPVRRKMVNQKEDLRWLARNLGIRNAGHRNFKRAVEILKEVV